MSSPLTYPVVVDDKDLDDAALWAMIDSASASHSSSKIKALVTPKFPTRQLPSPISNPSPPPSKFRKVLRDSGDSGEVVQDPWPYRPPRKAPRLYASEESSPLALIRSVQRTPPPMEFSSPDAKELSCYTEVSPRRCFVRNEVEEKESGMGHSLLGMFPSVSLFKEYQNAAMAILEKTDYTLISGNPFIKKSGWRKISCYFNISYEIRDKNIEFDENRNVQRAEFVIRAHMQGGRFSDGWGSCDRREKRFQKPNHDVPSTAETRAKNKACQGLRSRNLIGAGKCKRGLYRMGMFGEERKVMAVTIERWHKRLGHTSQEKLAKVDFLKGVSFNLRNNVCDSCSKAKHTRSPFPLSEIKTKECF